MKIKNLKNLINDLDDELEIEFSTLKYPEPGTIYCTGNPYKSIKSDSDVEIEYVDYGNGRKKFIISIEE